MFKPGAIRTSQGPYSTNWLGTGRARELYLSIPAHSPWIQWHGIRRAHRSQSNASSQFQHGRAAVGRFRFANSRLAPAKNFYFGGGLGVRLHRSAYAGAIRICGDDRRVAKPIRHPVLLNREEQITLLTAAPHPRRRHQKNRSKILSWSIAGYERSARPALYAPFIRSPA